MIKASELRIGNYVYNDQNMPVKVCAIESEEYSLLNGSDSNIIFEESNETDYRYSVVNPISLTEQWLIKLGLQDYELGYYRINDDIIINVDGQVYYVADDNSSHWIAELNFAHQLQNFYFLINGSELKIQE